MKVLITGASSGIGLEMAKILAKEKHELILVSRNKEKLEELRDTLDTKVSIILVDLSNEQKVKELYPIIKIFDIDMLINNAGFGLFGNFSDTDLTKELDMIDLNIKAVHILTKQLLKDMEKKNSGYILNVASSAAFQPGPLMATYYATKSYVYNLTTAIYYEEKKKKKDIKISVLCPGPVNTNFNNVAGVKFGVKALEADFVAEYALQELYKGNPVIIPGFKMRMARFFGRFVSTKRMLKIIYKIQKKKAK